MACKKEETYLKLENTYQILILINIILLNKIRYYGLDKTQRFKKESGKPTEMALQNMLMTWRAPNSCQEKVACLLLLTL